MDNSRTPDHVAHQLRAAVLAGDHAACLRLVALYGEALREYWTGLAPAERAVSTLPQQSQELLKWVRDMTLTQRAMTGEHLRIVHKALRYQSARAQYLRAAALEAHPA